MVESQTHKHIKKILAEGLEQLGYRTEVEKRFDGGIMDVSAVNAEGNEIEIEVCKTHMPDRFVVNVKGDIAELEVASDLKEKAISSRSLLTMLRIVASHGNEGISTRRVLQAAQSNDIHPLLAVAQKKGYITRVTVPQPDGIKGNHRVVNTITPSGLKAMEVIESFLSYQG
jgi:hypothetical protein